MRSSRSYTATVWPARVSCCAAASPAGPEPTTATVLPVRRAGGCGSVQPFANASSAIACSIDLIVTAGWLMPSTHDDSHGAGQSLPVSSGKLFVACRRSLAALPSPRQVRSFHSGMRLPSGQPWWQKGTPQSMQRPACRRSTARSPGSPISRQSRMRTGTGRFFGSSRSVTFRNPRGSATGHLQDLPPDVVRIGVDALPLRVEADGSHHRPVARHELRDALQAARRARAARPASRSARRAARGWRAARSRPPPPSCSTRSSPWWNESWLSSRSSRSST